MNKNIVNYWQGRSAGSQELNIWLLVIAKVTSYGYGNEARIGKGYGKRRLSLTGTIEPIFEVKRGLRALNEVQSPYRLSVTKLVSKLDIIKIRNSNLEMDDFISSFAVICFANYFHSKKPLQAFLEF